MTDHGNHANAWLGGKWPGIRARGMRHFVLMRGLVFWGGLMCAFMLATTWFKFGPQHPHFMAMVLVAASLCAVGGLAWGLLTWTINERIYHTLDNKRRSA
ncbi:MAG: hypothetical protein V4704_09755 [Pseudomonadota bacterium]